MGRVLCRLFLWDTELELGLGVVDELFGVVVGVIIGLGNIYDKRRWRLFGFVSSFVRIR